VVSVLFAAFGGAGLLTSRLVRTLASPNGNTAEPFRDLHSPARRLISGSKRSLMKIQNTKSAAVLLLVCGLAGGLAGCKEKSSAEPAFEKTKTSAQEAGDAIKDAAKKSGVVVKDAAKETGKVVGTAAEKTWDAMKKGAQEVSHAATNVAGEVKTGAEKVGDKIKDAVR
jgi:hypothetical protein